MQLINEPYFQLTYDKDRNSFYLQHKGFIPSDKYRMAMEKVIEQVKSKRPQRLIINLSEAGIFKTEDIQWLTQTAIPAIDKYVPYQAIVQPQSVFGKKSVDNIEGQRSESKQTHRVNFSTIEEAQKWIYSV